MYSAIPRSRTPVGTCQQGPLENRDMTTCASCGDVTRDKYRSVATPWSCRRSGAWAGRYTTAAHGTGREDRGTSMDGCA